MKTPSGARPDAASAREEDGRDEDDGDRGEGEDHKLRAMRQVWLAMREEEPPAGGMVELLAAARAKAVAMQPPSLWRRLLGGLRRPQVFAFAAVLVVIGGAVLVTRGTDRDSAQVAGNAGPEDQRDERARGAEKQTIDRPAPPAAETTTRVAPGGEGRSAAPAAPGAPPARPTQAPVRRRAAGSAGPQGPPAGAAAPRSPPAPPAPPAAASSSPAPPPPPPPPPPADRDVAEGMLDWAEPEAAGRDDAPLAPLVRACETAAARGDCAGVQRLVERITRRDPGYRARLAKDSAVARCLDVAN